uniref:Uncharacterized protein n=1 Tax=Anguilla anguilla TaxID=7936 RepID=A0A0E9Q1T6_ANGAN
MVFFFLIPCFCKVNI